jgi:hypothetical protein
MADIVSAGLHAKEMLVEMSDGMKQSRRAPEKTIAYGPDGELLVDLGSDPAPDVLGKWDWARVYYDAFMTVVLPTFDVITDWASLVSIAVTGLGGLFWNDCQLLRNVSAFWLLAIITILVATINGTILWGISLFLFTRKWPRDGDTVAFSSKLRIALEGLAEDQSTRFLCRREGEKSRFRWAHCHQLATLLLEDLPSLIATMYIIITIGGTIITLVSFCVSVLSFSKHIASYMSLGIVSCCRTCSRRTAVISRFCCCTFLCLALASLFAIFPFIVILAPSAVPQVLPVRSWSVRIPALGLEQRFMPPADLRSLKGVGYVLFGGVNGIADGRLDPTSPAHRGGFILPFLPLYGGDLSTLPFDEALFFDLFRSLDDVLDETFVPEGTLVTHGYRSMVKLWRRECDPTRTTRTLPSIAAGVFISNQQRCILDGFPENCTMSSARIVPAIDFFAYNESTMDYDLSGAFGLESIRPFGAINDELACTLPCFQNSMFCNGFGTNNRSQLAYAEIEIQFGAVEFFCLN